MPRRHRPVDAPPVGESGPDAAAARRLEDDKVDESLTESFPASDPPSFVPPARIGSPLRRRG